MGNLESSDFESEFREVMLGPPTRIFKKKESMIQEFEQLETEKKLNSGHYGYYNDVVPENYVDIMYTITASSGGLYGSDFADISINNKKVEVESNQNGHFRGIHIVIINQDNGKIELAKVFDTYESSDDFDKFIDSGIPKGHIIVAACKDECVKNMSLKGK